MRREQPRSVEGSGHVVTEQRPLAAFQQAKLEGEGRLIVGPDEPAALEVRTDDNLMALVDTTVVDGKLVIGIKPNRNLQPTDGVTYRVACDQLSRSRLSGSGEIEVNGCAASDLTVGLDGSGRVRVDEVDATRVDAEIGGSGTIRVAGTETRVGVSSPGPATSMAASLKPSTSKPRSPARHRSSSGRRAPCAPASVDPALSSIAGIPPSRRTSAVRAL